MKGQFQRSKGEFIDRMFPEPKGGKGNKGKRHSDSAHPSFPEQWKGKSSGPEFLSRPDSEGIHDLVLCPPPFPRLAELFDEPQPLREIVYPRYLHEPKVYCPQGKALLLSRLPFQNRCNCGSCGAKGWPQWMIRDFYRKILSMAPLPWADVVKPQHRIAQWRYVKPETPLPSGPQSVPTVASNYPTQNIRYGYCVQLLRSLDPEKKHQQCAKNLGSQNLEEVDVSAKLAEVMETESVLQCIQHRLEETSGRIKKDIICLRVELGSVLVLMGQLEIAERKVQDKEKKNGMLNKLKDNFSEESMEDLWSLIEEELKRKQQPAESSAPSEAPADPLRLTNRWSSQKQDPHGQAELEESQPEPQPQSQ